MSSSGAFCALLRRAHAWPFELMHFERFSGRTASTTATAGDLLLSNMGDQYEEQFEEDELRGAEQSGANMSSDQHASESGE
jgi:hypothetical protein